MYRMKITKEVQNEIDYLHNKYPHTEWSGVLALSFKEKKDYILFETIGIYPMNVGNNSSTSFSYKEKILNIYEYFNKKTSEKFILGTIHTHHEMSAFISGIDLEEIKDNVNAFNNYMFLVVDTKKTYVAKFARKKIMEIKSEYFLNFDNNKVYNNNLESKKTDTVIYDVKIEYDFSNVLTEFEQLVSNINPAIIKNKLSNSTNLYGIPTYDNFKTNSSFKDFLISNKIVNLNNNQKTLMLLLSSSLEDVFYTMEDMSSIMEYYAFINDCIEINTDISKITLSSLKEKVIETYNESSVFYDDIIPINEWIEGIIREIGEIEKITNKRELMVITKETVKVLSNLSKLLTKLKGTIYEY